MHPQLLASAVVNERAVSEHLRNAYGYMLIRALAPRRRMCIVALADVGDKGGV